ncbi:hypothetical protein SAY87_020456 [Trapa incisa]|uniref:Uncharacterized protein n=1 Tax=Trapa incisa TaxID=236973 RepID=A0AAN7JVT4_9MYRT|nr:hypothetical protein SAY87_020456 [Trapa incisa]
MEVWTAMWKSSLLKDTVQSIFLIASNAAVILPAYWALRQKAFAEWALFTCSGISSDYITHVVLVHGVFYPLASCRMLRVQ